MPSEQVLLDYILREIACKKDMMGMKVLVTAGPTMEAVDPVRYITNHSTGKMGYAVAKVCMLRGAQVTLVTGQTTVEKPPFVNVIDVTSAKEMFEAVTDCSLEQDIVVKAAAVADYRPQRVSAEKVKKTGKSMVLELEKDGRYPAVSGGAQALRSVSVRFFHGDGKYAGEFQKETQEKESGYDCSQQSQGGRSRLRNRHQCGDHDH